MATIKYKENGEWKELAIGGGGTGGGGSIAVDTELSLTSNNPVSNAVITSNIGVRFIDADINSAEGWQQVYDILISQEDNGALIPVVCLLDEHAAYVYTMDALGSNVTALSLIAICNGKTHIIPGGAKAIEYPFVFTDDASKKSDNQLRAFLYDDSWNEAVVEIDGVRYNANKTKLIVDYIELKVVVGNELRTYAVHLANVGDFEAGTLTLLNTESLVSGEFLKNYHLPSAIGNATEESPYIFNEIDKLKFLTAISDDETRIILTMERGAADRVVINFTSAERAVQDGVITHTLGGQLALMVGGKLVVQYAAVIIMVSSDGVGGYMVAQSL